MVDYKNRYPGINPHLNSLLQCPDCGWEMFHSSFIGRLTDELDNLLPEDYLPFSQRSLVSHFDDDENFLMAVIIYRIEGKNFLNTPVTRFELLSPANKPGGAHHAQYLRNRQETLLVGLRLVEIDWLHESRPVITAIPSYPDGEDSSYPYSIIVSDPRPTLDEGTTLVYGFSVEQPAPTINIPLDGEDFVTLDFGRVYNQTIERRNFFSLIDYTQEPAHFRAYQEKDRAYIRQHMAEINT